MEGFVREELASIQFDASCEFPPNISGIMPKDVSKLGLGCDGFEGNLYDYRELVELMLRRPDATYRRFLGATPSWDNTARLGKRASVFLNSSPELFGHWLTAIARRTAANFQGGEQIVFINAWNEWAEGCHLEPDQLYGRAYLEAWQASAGGAVDVERHIETQSDQGEIATIWWFLMAAPRQEPAELDQLYSRRFDAHVAYRTEVWKVLTSKFFSRYIEPGFRVMDLGVDMASS